MLYLVKKAIEKPDKIGPYLHTRFDENIGDPIKYQCIRWKTEDPSSYLVELDGYDLLVDLGDEGIGRHLALNGIREPITSSAYRNELRKLNESRDGPIRVIEAGANIGYYALMPAVDLDDTKIYAAEVDQSNVTRLLRNIRLNGLAEKFEVDCLALGDENGEMEVQLSQHSNRHSLKEEVKTDSIFTDTRTVPVKRGNNWLEEKDVAPENINVIRMDVEGFESQILQGMPDLDLDLVHIEIHPYLMNESETAYVIDWLLDQDLKLVAAGQNDDRVSLSHFGEIGDQHYVELVATKRD